MKNSFYLLIALLSFCTVFSQDIEKLYPTSEAIEQKLKEIRIAGTTEQNEVTLLQLKTRSESLKYGEGMLKIGYTLMKLYYDQGRYKIATELGNELKKKEKYYDNIPKNILSNIYRMNALALGSLGLNDASLKDFKAAINYSKLIEDKGVRLYKLALCYENLTIYYNNKDIDDKIYRDSILHYLDKSLDMAKQISDNDGLVSKNLKYNQVFFINLRLGVFYLEQRELGIMGSIEKAEKYLLDAHKIYEEDENNVLPAQRAVLMNQLSWLYMGKGDPKRSIDYAYSALELEKKNRNPQDRVESYEFLADSYLKLGENDKSSHYNDEYRHLKDSLTNAEKKNANAVMKKMVTEVDEGNKKNTNKLLVWVSGLVLIVILVALFFWRRNSRQIHKNYEQMIEKLKNDALNKDVKQTIAPTQHNISSDTERKILLSIEAFEKSSKFLKKDITLGLLANQFDTNTRYLSEIINKNRFQSFNNYLNGLRIDYIIHKLYNQPKYREYKISYLAEECGFASPQVFILAFRKIYGVTPFYFIQNLKKEEGLGNE